MSTPVKAAREGQKEVRTHSGPLSGRKRSKRKFCGIPQGAPVAASCTQPAVIVDPSTSISAAARLMRDRNAGALIVADELSPLKPVGIITDRDLVVAVVALDLDCSLFTVDDLMSVPAVVLRESDGVEDAIRLMCGKGVRRAPVLDGAGDLKGVVALHDLLEHLAGEIVRGSAISARYGQRATV